MKSVMQHKFSEVPSADIPRSSFNRSHGLKTTFDADYLVPILVDDIIPGDTFNVKANFFARLATPLHPIMDNLYLETFFFFVPYRLLWDNHEKFHGAQDNPGDSIDFTIPRISGSGSVTVGQLPDYMGLPIGMTTGDQISSLPFRAYTKIWNEWFRDENLQDSITETTGNGPDNWGTYSFQDLQKRGKRHDYFTSALPWPQKGTAVSMPLGQSADVRTSATNGGIFYMGADNTPGGGTAIDLSSGTLGETINAAAGSANIYADLSTATSATINDIRLAFQTQRLLERDARAGTRYVESLKAHWGVTSPDFRLQRPEFLGGGSSPINVTPVAQTSGQPTPAADDALGQLAGFGTVGGQHSFTKSFVEHGVLIGLVNVRADITYSQGIERFWSKATRYDFFYPVLAQIGEQSVLNKEIFWDGSANDDLVFGYQERYAEYRYKPSRLTGLMRPDAPSSLDAWHLSEDFASRPALGATFIESNTGAPLDRAIAIPSEPHFIADFFFDMKCARPMPLFGVPGNLDRF